MRPQFGEHVLRSFSAETHNGVSGVSGRSSDQARRSSTTCTFSYVASLVLIGGVIASTRTGDRPARRAPKPSRRVVRRAAAAAAAVGARARPPFLASVE